MKKVAKYFGKDVLAQVSEEKVIKHLPEVRKFAGDRAVLRALHFFEENKRVEAEVAALKEGRFNDSWKISQHPEILPGNGCRTALLPAITQNRELPLPLL